MAGGGSSALPGEPRGITLADGRSLHVRVAGSGRPTVVFEAGMGSSLGAWGAVVPGVAEHTTAVAYDRAGYGGSDPGPEPRTLSRVADDLVALLEQLDDDRFVLVGHSWGGPIVRQAAADCPDLVAGLVLADPSDEDMELFHTPAAARQRRSTVRALPWARRLGLVHLGAWATTRPLPPAIAASMRRTDTSATHVAAFRSELGAFDADLDRLRAEPLDAPDCPVTIVTGAKHTRKIGPGTGDEARRAVATANERRAASFPRGRHVSAPGSTHYVPFTDPLLLVCEILTVVDAARRDPHSPEVP